MVLTMQDFVIINNMKFKIIREQFVEHKLFTWHHLSLVIPNTHRFFIATRKEFKNGKKDNYIIC